MAAKAAAGKIPFLKRKRFLWVDGADVVPEDSANLLSRIFSQVAGRTDLILCLDALDRFLRGSTGGDHRMMLRGALREGRTQLIGVMSDLAFEDLLAADRELLALFTRVPVAEPELSSKSSPESKSSFESTSSSESLFVSW